MGTITALVDDVTSEPLGDEYFEVVLTRFVRNGEGSYARDDSQRVLEVARETLSEGLLTSGRTRGLRGRKGGGK